MSNIDYWRKNFEPLLKESFFGPRGLNSFFDDSYLQKAFPENQKFMPSVDIVENKTHYKLKFDLPGMNKDQIKIELHDKRLSVSGERKEERSQDDKTLHMSEVRYGTFIRTFTFPEAVQADSVQAKYDGGILYLDVPKLEPSARKQIAIK
jgi:HSP20 family protein